MSFTSLWVAKWLKSQTTIRLPIWIGNELFSCAQNFHFGHELFTIKWTFRSTKCKKNFYPLLSANTFFYYTNLHIVIRLLKNYRKGHHITDWWLNVEKKKIIGKWFMDIIDLTCDWKKLYMFVPFGSSNTFTCNKFSFTSISFCFGAEENDYVWPGP